MKHNVYDIDITADIQCKRHPDEVCTFAAERPT